MKIDRASGCGSSVRYLCSGLAPRLAPRGTAGKASKAFRRSEPQVACVTVSRPLFAIPHRGRAAVNSIRIALRAEVTHLTAPEVPLRFQQHVASTNTILATFKVVEPLIDGLEFNVLKSKTMVVGQFDDSKCRPSRLMPC